MKVTPGHFVMPLIAAAVGGLLIYAGLGAHWGIAWAAGGVFFITVGAAALLLALAWVLPGAAGAFLRHPITNIVILLAVMAALVVTVILGIAGR